MQPLYDVLIVGGGPAGAACALACRAGGLRTLVVERAVFPRDKVCGDCLNPDGWPVLARLGAEEAVRALPHVALRAVEFRGLSGASVRLPLPESARGEIAVKRSALDLLLLETAAARGGRGAAGPGGERGAPRRGRLRSHDQPRPRPRRPWIDRDRHGAFPGGGGRAQLRRGAVDGPCSATAAVPRPTGWACRLTCPARPGSARGWRCVGLRGATAACARWAAGN